MRHVRLAARMLLKTPFVTAIAVLSLALGIGANAAIFSMFDQLLRRPLPVSDPSRLVNFEDPGPKQGAVSCGQAGSCDAVFSYAMFRDLEKAGSSPFSGIAGHRTAGVSLSIRNEPMTADGVMVSGSYFGVLGLRPAAGRLLSPQDDDVPGAHFVAVITHRFWEDKFGRDPAIVGQSLVINGKSFQVVGVAPEGFDGTTVGARPVLFVPLSMRGEIQRFAQWENRRNYWVYLFARIKPGLSMAAAETAINGAYQPIIQDVEAPLQENMSAASLQTFRAKRLHLSDGTRGQSSIHREARTPIFLLFAVTGVVLLIACANVANLLLARGAGRATEMGVRLALGATRRTLIAQLLTESVLLAIAGGVASLLVAQWTVGGIGAMLPPEAAETMDLGLNGAVVAFAAGLSLVTGLVFGMFPALHSTRSDLISAIRAGAGQLTGGRAAARFRTGLVTAQIALSMGLLIMSALFLRSLVNVSRVDLGLQVDNIATFEIVPQRAGYDTVRSAVLFERVNQELAALPGVTGTTEALVPLLSGDSWGQTVRVQGFECGPDADCNASFNAIGADYFRTFGVPLVAGREFMSSDGPGAQRVAIVNEAFARKFGLGRDAVGKFIGTGEGDSLTIQIVGLVRDVKYNDVKDSVPPVFYLPWRQDARTGSLYHYVRTSLPPAQVLGTLRATMQRIDPNLPVEELKTMAQQVKENVFLDRMISTLSSAFALLATLLAGVGLYGVLAYSVAQRTREIGVRMALGADSARVRRLVLRQLGVMLAIGGTIGIAMALGLGRAAQSLLYEMQGHDPLALGIAVLLLACIALAAGLVPARRAARVDPMAALRYD